MTALHNHFFTTRSIRLFISSINICILKRYHQQTNCDTCFVWIIVVDVKLLFLAHLSTESCPLVCVVFRASCIACRQSCFKWHLSWNHWANFNQTSQELSVDDSRYYCVISGHAGERYRTATTHSFCNWRLNILVNWW